MQLGVLLSLKDDEVSNFNFGFILEHFLHFVSGNFVNKRGTRIKRFFFFYGERKVVLTREWKSYYPRISVALVEPLLITVAIKMEVIVFG